MKVELSDRELKQLAFNRAIDSVFYRLKARWKLWIATVILWLILYGIGIAFIDGLKYAMVISLFIFGAWAWKTINKTEKVHKAELGILELKREKNETNY